jgi:hypothetical protein
MSSPVRDVRCVANVVSLADMVPVVMMGGAGVGGDGHGQSSHSREGGERTSHSKSNRARK